MPLGVDSATKKGETTVLVTFKNKNTGKLVYHEGVSYFVPDETCLGLSGYGLHFTDNTYCLVCNETFEFVCASL